MPRVRAGEVQLGWKEWGEGDVTVVFIHGNLASKDWIELAAPLFPSGVRVIGIDWRGCGESDRPPPTPDFSNYSMRQHALDMLAALDELQISFCHLATHSTGGIIAARMLLKQPDRFGRVFALDPVTPLGMAFNAEHREGLVELQAFYERILEQTFGVSEGVWLGTPFNLNLERENGDLERRMAEIWHPHLVLWGEKDGWIAPADLKTMAAAMPDCRLVTVPGIGHSMNLESPALYAGYFGAWFGGLSGTEVAI